MIGRALFVTLLICAVHPTIWVAANSAERVETYIRGPEHVIESKSSSIVEEKPIIVEGKPIIVDEKPIIIEEKQVIVDDKPRVQVDTVFQSSLRPQVQPAVLKLVATEEKHLFRADPTESRIYGLGPKHSGAKCIRKRCSDSQKCLRKPEYTLANNIRAQISKLRDEYNRNTAAEHQRHRLAMSRKTLHHYFYLGEKFNHACEYTSLQIDCPAGFVIEVLSGFYGRQTNSVCFNKEIKNFHCSSGTAAEKIRNLCNNKQLCKISSSNSVFSDPCVGTYKYTAVKYRCRLASSVQGFACERSSLSIGCPNNYEIEVLHGFYGRETNDICQSRGVTNLRCRSGQATEVVRSLCDNRQGCTVASSNNIFGDPCVGTVKYMTVNYRCQIARSIRHRHENEKADMVRDHDLRLKRFEESYIRQLGDYNHRLKAALIGTEYCVARRGPKCGSSRCKWAEKCVNIPAFNEVVKFKAKMSRLRDEHNNKLASANRAFQTAIGSMTLDHLLRLGEKSKYACEYNTLAIDCPAGYVIEVMKAFYGRKTNRICHNAEIKNFKCSSGNAKAKIRSLCGNKQSCKVSSSNSVFGDPCVGTYKYTKVNYRCRLASSIELKACEHSSVSISCPLDFEIEVLNGFYGRKTNSVCYNKDVKDFSCSSGRATDAIRSLCNNKQACTIASSNSVFGDPCVGTYKYMTVTYRCRVSQALQHRHDRKRATYAHGHNKSQSRLKSAFRTQLQDLQHRLAAAKRGSEKCVPKRLGVSCGLVRCKWSEKCVKVPAIHESSIINAKISNLRRDFNRNLALENQKYQTAISRKTLDHMYHLAEKFAHACEYTSLEVDCPAGFVIDVLKGFYGRQTNSVCFNSEIKNFQCSSGHADQKIRSLCNNKQSCKISSSNSNFNDPCVGTYKYTTVRWRCRLASSVQGFACEHNSLSIGCPNNYELEVLSGFYGRETNSICHSSNVRDFRCRSSRATEVIRSLCNNRQGCTVASSNGIFGDPCVGTFKYMTMTYRCRVSRAIQLKHDRERAEISRDHNTIVTKLQKDFDTQVGDMKHRLSAAERGTEQCVRKAHRGE